MTDRSTNSNGLRAYRAFEVNLDGSVDSLYYHADWGELGELEATCATAPQKWIMRRGFNESEHLIRRLKERLPMPRHPVPDKDCNCGIYADLDPEKALGRAIVKETAEVSTTMAEIRVGGRVMPYTAGYRAQYAVIVAFISHHALTPWAVERASERYALPVKKFEVAVEEAREEER